jgi:hypothetical protein
MDTLVYVILPREVCFSRAAINHSPHDNTLALTYLVFDAIGQDDTLFVGEVRDKYSAC